MKYFLPSFAISFVFSLGCVCGVVLCFLLG